MYHSIITKPEIVAEHNLGSKISFFLFSDRKSQHKNGSQSADKKNLQERLTAYLVHCLIYK